MRERRASPIGLEELTAYVDGELDSGRRAVVERHLSSDAEAAARVAAYRRQDDCIRQGLAPLAEDGLSGQLRATLENPAGDGRWVCWRLAAVAAMLLAIIGSAGWWYHVDRFREQLVAALVHSALTAHMAYVSKEVTPDLLPDRSKLTDALRGVIGAGANLPDLSSLGYDLIGGEAMDTATGSAVLLAYRSRSGDMVTCYFSGRSENGETRYAVKQSQGFNVISRLEDGVGYAVIGTVATEELVKIARMGYRAISS
jgi:anti-sigma factor RsiW